jgi:hypothetical protein
MTFFDAYRKERAKLSTRESIKTLSTMEEYFLDGENWAQGVYQGAGNTRCIVAAAEHLRTSSIDDAKHWLQQAVVEQTGGAVATIEEFNDRQESFEGVKAVLTRAKQLALTAGQSPAPVRVVEPVRLAPLWDPPKPVIPQSNPWAASAIIDVEPESLPRDEPPKHEQEDRRSLWQKMDAWLD